MVKKKLLECFKMLGISPTRSLEEIRTAYRNQLKIWHPDKVSSKEAHIIEKHTIRSQKINYAYEFLKSSISLVHNNTNEKTETDTGLGRVYVVSSNLKWVKYNRDNSILAVHFKGSSGTYSYFNVRPQLYEELLKAPSKGKYFIRYIKNRHRFNYGDHT